jgi:hypothetical protein
MDLYFLTTSSFGFISPGVLNDAGGFEIRNGKIGPIPRWYVAPFSELTAAIKIIRLTIFRIDLHTSLQLVLNSRINSTSKFYL